jgi:VanZ family protein
MAALLRKICSNLFVPLGWTIFTIILLCLPGSTIPGDGLFSIPHLDKVAHVILFGGIVLFWGFYKQTYRQTGRQWQRIIVTITFLNIVLGIVLEYLQLYYIPNRSFDIGDIVADAAASILILGYLVFRKNKQSARG